MTTTSKPEYPNFSPVTLPPSVPDDFDAALTSSDPAPGRIEGFMYMADRYVFDFNITSRQGWAQLDTKADASYYGHWANPWRRQLLSYVEGDVTLRTMATDEEFTKEVREWSDWSLGAHGEVGKIDPGFLDGAKEAWNRLELGDLLH